MSNTTASRSGLLRRPFRLVTPLRYVPFSVDLWCPVMPSHALRRNELKTVQLLGQPVVVFRGHDGRVRALEDRCPHRGVALSMGTVAGNHLQCAYHGWLVDGCGKPCAAPNIGPLDDAPTTGAYAVKEHVGMIWAFLGDTDRADRTPLPDLGPYGSPASVDLALAFGVQAHWSFVLDNGIDLFHGHLHRDMPYFFTIHAIEDFGSEDDMFVVRYRATIGGPLRTRRKGLITVRTVGTGMVLDMDGCPVIYGLCTPHSADGRQLTIWCMISHPLPKFHRLVVRALIPAVRACLLRGFRQDAAVLASEQAAFDRGAGAQFEVSPVVPAAHRHIEDLIARRSGNFLRGCGRPESITRDELLSRARRGEVAIFAHRNGTPCLVSPAELNELLPVQPTVDVMRYHHCYFLKRA